MRVRVLRDTGMPNNATLCIDDEPHQVTLTFDADALTERGAHSFEDALNLVAEGWARKAARHSGPGKPIPVKVRREPNLPDHVEVLVDDKSDCITYTFDEKVITELGASELELALNEMAPGWTRLGGPAHPGSITTDLAS